MTLKEWTKTDDDEIGFVYLRNDKRKEIDYHNKTRILQVYLHNGLISEIKFSKKFKNKKEALKHAKFLMKIN
jgi:hypothetical protein